jgi:pilus assembly protein CpaB
MNRRLVAILLAAFVIASACTYLIWRLLGSRLGAAKAPTTTRVVAAAADIKLGTVLTAANLTTVEIAGPMPKGAILDPKNAIGRGVVADLYQGEPVLDSRLAAPGSGGGLAAIIPPGMRACAVRVDEVVGVAGFVTPGQHVDVLVSGIPPGSPSAAANEGTEVKTILQNLAVLSAGTDIQKDAEGKPQQVQVVNLLVNPEQAETLSLAANGQTRIQLVLRNPLDQTVAQIPGTAMANLFEGGVKPKPVEVRAPKPAPKPKPFSIEIINGSKRSEENFGTPEAKQ